jgi:transglutaminase-like putative cysteine protease
MMQRRQEFWHMSWLIAAVLIVSLPHLAHIRGWVSGLLLGILVWRLIAADKGWRMPSGWVRLPLAFLVLAGIIWSYRRISGVEAGSALLLVMLAFKLLETRSRRDRMVVAMICFVLMFAAFLREQAIWSSVYLLSGVALTVTALLQSGTFSTRMPVTAAGRYTLILLLQALPIMALLFVLFPRVPGPFWAMPTQSSSAMTGLGETVNPGDITELGRSDAVAFRVRFDGAVPVPAQRYWRGPVMSYFNGRAWSYRNRGVGPDDLSVLRTDGPVYDYEITMEPHGRRWLLALETPSQWDHKSASFSPDWQLINKQRVTERFVYTARSTVNGTIPGNDSHRYLQAMRHLPDESNPRTRNLARQLRGEASDDVAYLSLVLDQFRNQPFFYTLTPPPLDQDPVDQFLFETREGFCEHYASAFAVLARAAGIPARVVTGYLGAELNPLGDYWVVRQSDAHAWTEVWINNQWRRYDPTAAVAPERIEIGMDTAIPDAGRSPVTLLRQSPFLGQMVLSIDAANAAWDQWVLGFGPDAQMELLQKLGFKRPSLRHLVIFALTSCGVFLGILAWLMARPEKRRVDPAMQLYRRFCARLTRHFRAPLPNEGPADYARAATLELPQLREEIRGITRVYLKLRYEMYDYNYGLRELRKRIRGFHPSA